MLLIGLLSLLLATAISSSSLTNEKSLSSFPLNLNNKGEIQKELDLKEEGNFISFSSFRVVRITSLLLLFSAYLSYNCNLFYNIGGGIGVYGGLFQISYLSQNLDIFLYLIGGFLLFSGSSTAFTTFYRNKEIYNRKENLNSFSLSYSMTSEYAYMALFSILGGSLLMMSKDLVSMYISIELQSFALYLLSTVYRDYDKGARGGLKYFLLGGISSCFILLGIGILYRATGLTNIDYIFVLYSEGNLTLLIEIGFLIILVGLLFKISAAPFHNWAPDVYDGVATLVTLWLSVITKISISIFILSLFYSYGQIDSNIPLDLNNITPREGGNLFYLNPLFILLTFSAFLSLIIGTIVGLVQFRIKRLLTYSTISHIGFILMALIVNNKESFGSLLFYLVGYSIVNANNFLILIAFGYLAIKTKKETSLDKYSPIQYIDDLNGSFYMNKLLSICFAISLFSLAGVPPAIGFFTKLGVLMSALSGGYIALSIVAILVSVISAAYYLKIISRMFFIDDKRWLALPLVSSLPSSSLNQGQREDLYINNKETNYYKDKEGNLLNLGGETINPLMEERYSYLSNVLSFSISLLTLISILFIIKPYLLLNWTHLLALSSFLG